MKTSISVLNSITKKSSKNFENKLAKLLPEGVNEIYLSSVGMSWEGRGSYNYFVDISINGDSIFRLKERTTDSMSYDSYQDLDYGTTKFDNWAKNTALMLLEENQDLIIEYLNEENE